MYLNHFSKYRLIIIKKVHIFLYKSVLFEIYIQKPKKEKKDACILSIIRNYILNKKSILKKFIFIYSFKIVLFFC
jgi:hypothetical protein